MRQGERLWFDRFSPAKSFLVSTVSSFLISCFLISRSWFYQYPLVWGSLLSPRKFFIRTRNMNAQNMLPCRRISRNVHVDIRCIYIKKPLCRLLVFTANADHPQQRWTHQLLRGRAMLGPLPGELQSQKLMGKVGGDTRYCISCSAPTCACEQNTDTSQPAR